MSMKVVFVGLTDGTDPRETKICNSLVKLGHDVAYIGWNRNPHLKRSPTINSGIPIYIFEYEKDGGLSLPGWLSYFRFIARHLKKIRPDVVHARDEVGAGLVLPFKRLFFRYLILDIFDSLLRYEFSSPVSRTLSWGLRKTVYCGSDRIIETSDQLRQLLGPYVAQKTTIILNVPNDPGEELARMYPEGPTVQIFTGGSIERKREGLEFLLQAAESLPQGTVQIRSSGRLEGEYAQKVFAKHPLVDYQWMDIPQQYFERIARCDAITYLRGDAENTEYRSWVLPNRVFDAMSVARPLIVSSALKISSWIEQQKLGYVVDPGDYRRLAQIFVTLKDQRPQLPVFAQQVRKLFVAQYTWQVMEERLYELYRGLVS
jgi:glycosyltransferase involved in cell wall biosynthesis